MPHHCTVANWVAGSSLQEGSDSFPWASCPGGARADVKVIRISTPGTDTEWQSKALVAFKDALEKSMPGVFDVQIHYNGTLFAQGTEIEAMQRGNLEVALTSPADLTELIPEYSIFTTGYLMRDAAHLDAVYDGDVGKEVKAKVATDLGLQILRSQYLGTRHVILREPRTVNVPADLAGVKLRMAMLSAWLSSVLLILDFVFYVLTFFI